MRIHRQWFILGAASLALLIGGSAWGVSAIESASRGPAFKLSTTCLRVNGRARKLLGVIKGYGLAVTGPVIDNQDGTGRARIQFDVIGQWRTGRANVHAVEQAGVWKWSGYGTLAVGGKRYRLQLSKGVHVIGGSQYSTLCAPPRSSTRFPPS